MSSSKYKGLWPLPGGTNSYVLTLTNILEYIKQNSPTFNQLISWFKEEYNLTGSQTPRSMLHYLMRFGFFQDINDKIMLSSKSDTFVNSKDKHIVYEILNNKVMGIEDILLLLDVNDDITLNEINKWFKDNYNVNWGTTMQVSFRVNWLRSLGYIKLDGHYYRLTEEGKHLITNIKYDQNNFEIRNTIKIEDENEKNILQKQKKGTKVEVKVDKIVEQLISELLESQYNTENPERYEKNVEQIFSRMGFITKHIGGSGEPDIHFKAPQGSKSYSGIIDCKTGSKIGDNRIDWFTLEDHKKSYNADYIVVIAPDFAGGRLLTRANESNTTLIKTEQLIEILKMHYISPLNLSEYEIIFNNIGILSDKIIDVIKNNEFNVNKKILKDIFLSIIEITKNENELDMSGLLIYLNYVKGINCNRESVEEILSFLNSKLINAIKIESGLIIPTMTIQNLRERIQNISIYLVES